MFTQPVKLILLLLLALTLSACATYQDVTSNSKTVQSNDWTITGKLAFISPKERVSANLHWRHLASSGKDELRLTGPLGRNVLSLSAFPGFASITMDGKTYTGKDADSLIVRLTGWPLPLSQLGQYLLGQTTGSEQISTDANNQLASVQLTHPRTGQKSQLHYRGWQQLAGYKVPKQIELHQQQQRIKLAIKSWQPEL
ncbi:lipoprotein insertase outer membrane protein LolB [uncultured Ferrimonas sp.]|uniref:lipoprotein insertase outer membrane protein LolB n=1 Tax=uncultured Ferrimonas sp. TaxID=432640 RepID=UPI00261423C7|nr:lipoprotein insertase outer membrane protein LolB [uncultured Ferrimonas sp.]